MREKYKCDVYTQPEPSKKKIQDIRQVMVTESVDFQRKKLESKRERQREKNNVEKKYELIEKQSE